MFLNCCTGPFAIPLARLASYGFTQQQQPPSRTHRSSTIPPPEPVISSALTVPENQYCLNFMSYSRCSVLSIGVAQLFATEAPDHDQWTLKSATGIVGFIKDWTRRSFYIRFFDFRTARVIWEQEIYDELKDFNLEQEMSFCYFEAHESLAGFLFAEKSDAFRFKAAIDAKIQLQQFRLSQKLSNQRPMSTIPQISSQISTQSFLETTNTNSPKTQRPKSEFFSKLHLKTKDLESGASDLSKRLTLAEALVLAQQTRKEAEKAAEEADKQKKNHQFFPSRKGSKVPKAAKDSGGKNKAKSRIEISAPILETFKVENHVGTDTSIDFNDPAVTKLISGITDLGKMTTRKQRFIEDFLKQNGGMEAVRNYISLPIEATFASTETTVVTTTPAKTSNPRRASSQLQPPSSPPPPPPVDKVDTEIPVTTTIESGLNLSAISQTPTSEHLSVTEPVNDEVDNVSQRSVPFAVSNPFGEEDHFDFELLLQQIRSHGGTATLRKVTEKDIAHHVETRDRILSKIKEGVALKKVDSTRRSEPPVTMQDGINSNDLGTALRAALMARRDILEYSSSEGDSSAESWKDDD